MINYLIATWPMNIFHLIFLLFTAPAIWAISLDAKDNKITQQLIKELHLKQHIPKAWTTAQFKSQQADFTAIENIQKPLEAKPWVDYRRIMITQNRIQRGARILNQYRTTFNHYQKKSGIPSEIIAAIMGVETNYGKTCGSLKALNALATLGYYYSPRSDFFMSELKTLLINAYQNKLNLRATKSSYAGALGIPQFMPSALTHYAIPHKLKSKADIIQSLPDAIASIDYYLTHRGKWHSQASIIKPVVLNVSQKQYLQNHELIKKDLINIIDLPESTFPELHQKQSSHTPVALRQVRTLQGQYRYFVVYDNFKAIMSYNPSSHYAHAVMELAEKIRKASRERNHPITKKP